MPRKRKTPKPAERPAQNGGAHDKLALNKDFAERYEATERRKLLSSGRFVPDELLSGSGGDASSSSEEDEFGELLTKGIDRRVRDTLEAIQKKDPRIYDQNVKFFSEKQAGSGEDAGADGADVKAEGEGEEDDDSEADSEDEPVAGWDTIAAAAEKDTPNFTVKDYVRENLLKHGNLSDEESSAEEAESDEDDDDGDNDDDVEHQNGEAAAKDARKTKSKQTSLSSGDGDGDDGNADDDNEGGSGSDEDFFTKREKTKEEAEEEELDFQKFLTKQTRRKTEKTGDDILLHSYLEKETPDEKERFLRDFVLNNGWLDKNKGEAPRADDYSIEVDLPKPDGSDEDEEKSGDEDANADPEDEFDERNDQFEAKYNFRFEEEGADRIATHARTIPDSMRRPDDRRKQARAARRERKRREREEKVSDLKRLKNEKKREIKARLLAIREAAGEEVDVNGLDLEGDFDPDKFNAAMESRFGDDYYARGDDEMQEELGKGAELASEKRVQSQEGGEASEEVRRDVDKLMDEYYNLDFEDIVGGKPVRFKYKQVEPESFGLTAEDILEMDDKDLNRTVSLKYLAPYRSRRDVQKQAWKVRNRLNQRTKSGQARKAEEALDRAEEGEQEQEQQQQQEEKGSASQRKRKKRKKMQKGEDDYVVVEDREGVPPDAIEKAAD